MRLEEEIQRKDAEIEFLQGHIQALQAVLVHALDRLERFDQIAPDFYINSVEFHHAIQRNFSLSAPPEQVVNTPVSPSIYFQEGHKACLDTLRKLCQRDGT